MELTNNVPIIPNSCIHLNYLLYESPECAQPDKTALVRSLAAETGLFLKEVDCAELESPFYNETILNINNLFASAKTLVSSESCPGLILYLDHLSYFCENTKIPSTEKEKALVTLNGLLDKENDLEGLIVIGSTDYKNQINPSLLSRFHPICVYDIFRNNPHKSKKEGFQDRILELFAVLDRSIITLTSLSQDYKNLLHGKKEVMDNISKLEQNVKEYNLSLNWNHEQYDYQQDLEQKKQFYGLMIKTKLDLLGVERDLIETQFKFDQYCSEEETISNSLEQIGNICHVVSSYIKELVSLRNNCLNQKHTFLIKKQGGN